MEIRCKKITWGEKGQAKAKLEYSDFVAGFLKAKLLKGTFSSNLT